MPKKVAKKTKRKLKKKRPEEEDKVWACETCLGTNVQCVMWCDANTNEAVDEYGTWNYPGSIFCADCDNAEDAKLVYIPKSKVRKGKRT